MAGRGEIGIEDHGIGTVLKHNQLCVPLNQREYSWEEKEVTDLFQDLHNAINDSQSAYFLGTIALTGTNPKMLEVTDGQQRLATTTILLASMRDYYYDKGDAFNVDRIDTEFLTIPDPEQRKRVPRLTLNFEDREFFAKQIATLPTSSDRCIAAKLPSHKRIRKALELAREHIETIVAGYKKDVDKDKQLQKWIDFISNRALVIALLLPNDMNAFQMFETLNDRGLKTSQVDIIKNHLFRQADDRMKEVQPMWSRMLRELESLEADDIALTFLRHFIITKEGVTRERELFSKVEGKIIGRQRAIDFVGELDENSSDYVALMTPDNKKWNTYPPSIRRSIRTMRLLRVAQIRPLMLAVARTFSPAETEAAFRIFVNWTVRFLVAGGGRGGLLDEHYSSTAKDVNDLKLKNVNDLFGQLGKIIPGDSEFEAAFAVARVSKNYLARYYLRALELKQQGSNEPEWVPNDDVAINLEHILPENPSSNWPALDAETADAHATRLGNLALLQATRNSIIGNAPFSEKRTTLALSAYVLTAEAGQYSDWTPIEIAERQKRLAKLAVKTWPLKLQ